MGKQRKTTMQAATSPSHTFPQLAIHQATMSNKCPDAMDCDGEGEDLFDDALNLESK